MTETKHPPEPLTMTPEMLLTVASAKIFYSGIDVTITHVIGFLNGELVVKPAKAPPEGMIICGRLTPPQLKHGLKPYHWNQLSQNLHSEHLKLKL